MEYRIIQQCLITIDNEEEFNFLSDKLLFKDVISFEDKFEFSIEADELQKFIKNTESKNKIIKEILNMINKQNNHLYKYIFEFWKI